MGKLTEMGISRELYNEPLLLGRGDLALSEDAAGWIGAAAGPRAYPIITDRDLDILKDWISSWSMG